MTRPMKICQHSRHGQILAFFTLTYNSGFTAYGLNNYLPSAQFIDRPVSLTSLQLNQVH